MARQHLVADGECLASVAFECGFHPDTIWNDDANSELRKARNPYALQSGDALVVPDLTVKQVPCVTGKVHRFRRLGVPEKFRARLCEDGNPRAKIAYELTIGDVTTKGETDDDGRIEQWMPPDARSGRLKVVRADKLSDVYELTFGTLAPIDTDEGVRRRLVNLGYLSAESSSDDAASADALRAFQSAQALAPTGVIDDSTRTALRSAYGE
jgi:hypothetical protein